MAPTTLTCAIVPPRDRPKTSNRTPEFRYVDSNETAKAAETSFNYGYGVFNAITIIGAARTTFHRQSALCRSSISTNGDFTLVQASRFKRTHKKSHLPLSAANIGSSLLNQTFVSRSVGICFLLIYICKNFLHI
jgi:hypothetical protein